MVYLCLDIFAKVVYFSLDIFAIRVICLGRISYNPMNYNFNDPINRLHTDSVKWDGIESRWGRTDLIPMWVADMDFRTAPFIIEAR